MNSARFYDRISVVYPFINRFLKSNKQQLINTVNSLPKGRLLELGIGHGFYVKYYKDHDIVGIDQSEEMLKLARKNLRKKIELTKMNAEKLSFPIEHFDIIVISHVLSIQKQPNKLLDECHKVLKKGGKILILNHFTPKNIVAIVDYLFQPIANFFHFNSYFKVDSLKDLKKFKMLSTQKIGWSSYFQLVTLEKK